MTTANDPYKILGLKPNATAAEVKQAYRKLARQWHPDQFQSLSEKQKAEAEIKRINIAYSQLKDPSFQPGSSASAPGSSPGSNHSSSHGSSGESTVKKDSQAQRLARAQSYYRQAETLEKTERYQDATKALTLAINLVPDYAEAYQYRAYLYDLRGFEFLAAKDKKRAKTLGLEKTFRSYPKEESPPAPKKAPDFNQFKRWRPKGWGESSRPKAASAPPKSQAKPPSEPARSASSSSTASSSGPAQTAQAPPSAPSSNRSSVFSFPQPMAAVEQSWDCTATLKSPTGRRAGAIIQLMPYGSTNGISASANGLIQLWNFERGYDFADLTGHSDEVLDFDLNADGQLLSSASQDGTIKLWHLSSASLTRSFEAGAMTSLIFGPERHTLSCCNASGEVRQWNSSQESGSPQTNLDRWGSRAATYLGLSANRKILISRSPDRSLHRYLLEESVPSRSLAESQFEQTCIALSPSSRHIAAGDRTGLIRLWNLQTAEPIMAIQGRAGSVKAIAFTPDNRLIASLCHIAPTATHDGSTIIQLWSRPSREHLCDIPGEGFTSLCFSGDSKRLITGTAAGELKIWQPQRKA